MLKWKCLPFDHSCADRCFLYYRSLCSSRDYHHSRLPCGALLLAYYSYYSMCNRHLVWACNNHGESDYLHRCSNRLGATIGSSCSYQVPTRLPLHRWSSVMLSMSLGLALPRNWNS